MDALIYTLMSGADRAMRAQQVHANNLANVDTAGFRANLELADSNKVEGYGYDTRYMSQLQADSLSMRVGTARETGNPLDVAIQGDGLLAVQTASGEAYTRGGPLMLDAEGTVLLNNRPVMGDSGPIVLPEHTAVQIGEDGSVQILPPGEQNLQTVDRLRLVRGESGSLTKNSDGLIVARNGADLPADDTVRVRSGFIEGSNVSAVEEMVATMSLNREFEIQMKLYKAADSMADSGNRLVRE
jgi:flagellar basal-body rod protein FlgF